MQRLFACAVAFTLIAATGAVAEEDLLPALVVPVSDQYPAVSPDGEWIGFESRRADGIDHIFVARRDGSELRQLTDALEDDETPVFSPDGKRILFARKLGEGRTAHLDIFSIDVDGENLRNLSNTPDAQDDHHKFSADGKQIVFNSSRSTPFSSLSDAAFENYEWNYDIWVMDADGANQRPLVELPGWDTFPSFSPDGETLLWRRVLPTGGGSSSGRNSEIFVAAADGSGARNISNHPAFDGYPAYSPDGRWIAFASSRVGAGADPDNIFRLFIMRPDGSDVRQVTDPPAGYEDARPSWTPDGKALLFNRDAGADSRIMELPLAASLTAG